MSKEKMIMKVLNGFCFNDKIEKTTYNKAYDLALKRLLEISEQELENYSIGDYANIIGDLLEDGELDIYKLFIELNGLTQDDYNKLKELGFDSLENIFDFHFEFTEDEYIDWQFEDCRPSEVIGYKIEEDSQVLELSDGFYYFYN